MLVKGFSLSPKYLVMSPKIAKEIAANKGKKEYIEKELLDGLIIIKAPINAKKTVKNLITRKFVSFKKKIEPKVKNIGLVL